MSFKDAKAPTSSELTTLSKLIRSKSGHEFDVSTLNKIWSKEESEEYSTSLLDVLTQYLGFENWLSFKDHVQKKQQSPLKLVLIGLVFIVAIWLIYGKPMMDFIEEGFTTTSEGSEGNSKIIITGPLHFEASSSPVSDIPATIVFNYDLSNIKADSFFFQPSEENNQRYPIDPEANFISETYFLPGFHQASVFAFDSLIARTPVHITNEGFEPQLVFQHPSKIPVNFKDQEYVTNGKLFLGIHQLNQHRIDLNENFHMRVTNSQDFNLRSPGFTFFSRLKVDSISDKICPWLKVNIVMENKTISCKLVQFGCEKYAEYQNGTTPINSTSANLQKLGTNVYEWHEIEIHSSEKHIRFLLDSQTILQIPQTGTPENIKALIYEFDGKGSLDYVKLNDQDGHLIVEEDF